MLVFRTILRTYYMNDLHGREQIRKTTGWLYRANVTLSEVFQLLIHSYFEFIIQSKI